MTEKSGSRPVRFELIDKYRNGTMTDKDRLHLRYIAASGCPVWGGHIDRGEPITDHPEMARWLANGWMERGDTTWLKGYRITAVGLRALQQTPEA